MCEINFNYCLEDVVSSPNIRIAQNLVALNFELFVTVPENRPLFNLYLTSMHYLMSDSQHTSDFWKHTMNGFLYERISLNFRDLLEISMCQWYKSYLSPLIFSKISQFNNIQLFRQALSSTLCGFLLLLISKL